MLSYISVKNFAIIENIEVYFHNGMTALTGETGAGKSLLIDAIGLLLGDRATSNIVRTGSEKAIVEGLFHISNENVLSLLDELELRNDNELLIRRQITQTNNNIIKVNNQTITLAQLREITSLLADIHTQFDTHRLINQDTYLSIIDGFKAEETETLLTIYNEKLTQYKDEIQLLHDLKKRNETRLERLDLMKFQLAEIEGYDLNLTEEDELNELVEKMQNFDKIFTSLNEANKFFTDTSSIDNIYSAKSKLGEASEYSDVYQELEKRTSEAYFELLDINETLQDELAKLDFNPNELDAHLERLNALETLKRKYRKEIPDIIDYYETIKHEIEHIDHFDDVIKEQEEQVKDVFLAVTSIANKLTALRKTTSQYIEHELLSILDDLELKKTVFNITFTKQIDNDFLHSNQFTPVGVDEVDFLLSTNIGEPLKPLSKSASGGEMSRIMLGLKNLLVKSLQLSLIIFDEIDTGVSGYVANQVAKKMKNISANSQVICITHIPQVAALSDHHLYISKRVVDDRTIAEIKTLDGENRVYEIASMISGENVSKASIVSARELIK